MAQEQSCTDSSIQFSTRAANKTTPEYVRSLPTARRRDLIVFERFQCNGQQRDGFLLGDVEECAPCL